MLIAQISDLHAQPDGRSLRALDKVVAWLLALGPDAVVLSGDLVNNHWADGYGAIADRLAALACPVHALPGNSDEPPLMRSALAGKMTWAESTGPMHFDAIVGDSRLIGLDVTVTGKSHGDALPHLAWLRSTLARDAGPVLLFMHQPPIATGIEAMDRIGCRHADQLEAVLRAAPRRPLAILCGHVHRPIVGKLGDFAVHICGSLCPANPVLVRDAWEPPVTDGPSILVHDTRNGHLVVHTVAFPAD